MSRQTSGATYFYFNYTADNGKTFFDANNQIMYGAFIYVADNVNEYTYEAATFISLVSELGGFIEIMYIFLMAIPFLFNAKVAEKMFIDKLYFVDKA